MSDGNVKKRKTPVKQYREEASLTKRDKQHQGDQWLAHTQAYALVRLTAAIKGEKP
jgi:hypothetical protein